MRLIARVTTRRGGRTRSTAVRSVRRGAGRFAVRTPRLTRGRHVLEVVAVSRAGARSRPVRVVLRVR